jgi:acylphosphatase
MIVKILVKGRVQGVFFRASTKEKAQELKIVGNVKNLANGNVEIYAKGSEKNINELVEWCKEGPRLAHVEDIFITKSPDVEIKSNTFRIIR